MPILHFTDEGSGTPLVFIHGYCESHSIWSEFVRPFTNHYRVICLDLPGFGQSKLPSSFTIPEITQTVWSFLDSIDVKTCFVVGHSLGGYITMEMANQQADRMEGFCMFHSTAYADDENKKLNRTKVMEFVAKNGTAPFVQTLLPSLFADPQHPMAEILLKEARNITPDAVIGYAGAMRDRSDTTKVYVSFSKPVLFFMGMKDTVILPESISEQAELLTVKMVCPLTEVAHMGMLEATSHTQSTLIRFLQDSL